MKSIRVSLAALALAAIGSATQVLAGAPPPGLTTGTVNSIQGDQVVINGTSYTVSVEGEALQQLQQVRPGQTVDIVLNGPPGAVQTQIVAIHVHTGS